MNSPSLEKWNQLWRNMGCEGVSRAWYERLANAYSEPQRHYHNFQHIAECLEIFESARTLAEQPHAVEMAIWFHDAVYDPKAPDNEERSAAMAAQCLGEASVGQAFIQKVTRLIMATKSHDASTDVDAPVLVDVDLSILGQSNDRFRQYESQIRREYLWVPVAIFSSKRGEILKQFLGRKRIYITDLFHNRFEQQARKNIQSSIRALEAMIT
ncbi:MAG: hypothetical protein JWR26_4200 [Pedosphaera sp.]|nr:hypothetical protein [Pedosphaera sp.]